jgi:TRAP-type C4-dicarboxylate transport system substrate-binding protein
VKKLLLFALAILLMSVLIISSCAAPTSAPSPAPTPTPTAEKPIELKLSSWVPPQSTPSRLIMEPWAAEVEKASGGKVHITHYADCSLGAMMDHWNMLLTGQADLVLAAGYTGILLLSEVGFLPFIYPTAEVQAEVNWKLAEKYMFNTEMKDVKPLYFFSTGMTNMFTNKKQVRTLEDLKGMKFCTGERIEADALTALGATGVVITRTEMYTSLERGLADGSCCNWEEAFVFKDAEVTKYRTANIDAWTHPMLVFMNLNVWNSLPPDIQKVFEETSGFQYSKRAGAIFDGANAQIRGMIAEQDQKAGKPEMYNLPTDERARWVEATAKLREEWANTMDSKGLPGKAVLEEAYSLVKEYSK